MGWDGNLYFCPTTSYHPITITQLSDISTKPYHLPQLLPSHPTHHDKTYYHPNPIPSVSHVLYLSHVHTVGPLGLLHRLLYIYNVFRQREHFYVFYTAPCVCVRVFFPFILDIKFVGRTSRGHTGEWSHRIYRPPSFCGACLNFSREKDSAIPFPRRP